MKLTQHIVEHIFENLGMFSNKNNSIFTNSLQIKQEVIFEENEKEIKYPVFVCETVINQLKMSIAACKFSDDPKEMISIIALENSPNYGCYINIEDKNITNAVIAVQIKDNMWIPTSVFIQASFLAGMEQLKDLGGSFSVCSKPDDIYPHLLSFIKYLDQNAG